MVGMKEAVAKEAAAAVQGQRKGLGNQPDAEQPQTSYFSNNSHPNLAESLQLLEDMWYIAWDRQLQGTFDEKSTFFSAKTQQKSF